MDPNATYRALLEALRDGELEDAREAFDNLAQWLERGGFPPTALAAHAGQAAWAAE